MNSTPVAVCVAVVVTTCVNEAVRDAVGVSVAYGVDDGELVTECVGVRVEAVLAVSV